MRYDVHIGPDDKLGCKLYTEPGSGKQFMVLYLGNGTLFVSGYDQKNLGRFRELALEILTKLSSIDGLTP